MLIVGNLASVDVEERVDRLLDNLPEKRGQPCTDTTGRQGLIRSQLSSPSLR